MSDGLRINAGLTIPLHEVELRATRSSGPGGQHANVTASRIEAVFEIDSSQTLPAADRDLLRRRHGRRITAVAQEARGQARNRELALERLRERIAIGLRKSKPRRATRPTRAAKQRRIVSKRHRSEIKRGRKRPSSDD